MTDSWWAVALPLLTAVLIYVVPGLVVLVAGWGVRRPGILFLAPAVSTALVAVSALAGGLVGIGWSPLPVAALTVVAAVVAYLLRRRVGPEDTPRPSSRAVVASIAGLAGAAVVITIQLMHVFIGPENISQTFDNIIHLNSVAHAVATADASPFALGRLTDIPFYPNGWHSVASLVAIATGASVPLAVTATNIAVAAVVWPASSIALAWVLFRGRPTAIAATAALSTGFGAFPILLFDFGVLYPNVSGYAIVPAGIATVLLLWNAPTASARIREGVLALVVAGGVFLAHPNAFLALWAIAAFTVWTLLLRGAIAARSRRTWAITGVVTAAIVIVSGILWWRARTPFEMSRWGPWQSTAQAFGEATLLSPRAYPVTLAISVLIVVGLISVIRHPRRLIIAVPFLVAGFLFVIASGGTDNWWLREVVANPWYNDSYRFAALLPVAGIPVAALGAVATVDAVSALAARRALPAWVRLGGGVVAVLALFALAGWGPNVQAVAEKARTAYAADATSALLSDSELALLERLDETTPEDALIAGSPRTGASLAYAIAGRDVMEYHVFGTRTDDEVLIDEHLRDIDSDPAVCDAVRATGVDYVLDFGDADIFGDTEAAKEHAGVQDLEPGEHLVLVDSEGADARLFRIEGC